MTQYYDPPMHNAIHAGVGRQAKRAVTVDFPNDDYTGQNEHVEVFERVDGEWVPRWSGTLTPNSSYRGEWQEGDHGMIRSTRHHYDRPAVVIERTFHVDGQGAVLNV